MKLTPTEEADDILTLTEPAPAPDPDLSKVIVGIPEEPLPPPPPTVAELLQLSKGSHEQYRLHLPRRGAGIGSTTQVEAGDPSQARTYLADAARFRAQAHLLDPTLSDPAWKDQPENLDHFSLLAYYVRELTK